MERAQLLRKTLSQFATGVTVVTVGDGELLHGMTANSFTSVSLVPPLILISVANQNFTLRAIRQAGHFTVNILSAHQEGLARRFATPGIQGRSLFDGVAFVVNKFGDPVLDETLGHLACELRAEYEEGDHTLLIGHVHDYGEHSAERAPLIFYGSHFYPDQCWGMVAQA